MAAAVPAWADTVVIQAKGTIPSSCAVTLKTNFAQTSNFSQAGQSTATAEVNCNAGFAIKATSLNGAVKTAKPAPTGFTNMLPYSVALSVPLDDGGTLAGTCAAAAMKAGQAGCAMATGDGLVSNGKSAIGKTATLTAGWPAPATQPIAGSYSDTITISVAPKS